MIKNLYQYFYSLCQYLYFQPSFTSWYIRPLWGGWGLWRPLLASIQHGTWAQSATLEAQIPRDSKGRCSM